MNELIKITTKNGIETVSARALYKFLDLDRSQWSRWSRKNIEEDEYFDEGIDYLGFDIMSNGNQTKDYALSIDMAKELSMLARNKKGKEARQYFIEVEKRAREISMPKISDDEMIRNAMMILDSRVKKLEAKIEEDKDKVQFFHDVTGSKDAVEMSKVAKILDCGMGRNQLFDFLRANKVLRENNEPYQKFVDSGWFRVIEQKYEKHPGEISINIKTLVYQKGIDGILKIIRRKNND